MILASSWSYGLAWIVSAGEPLINNKTTGFVQYTPDTFLFWMRFYHVFGLLWLAQFVMACQHMVIAGAVAGWYFSRYYVKRAEHFVLNNQILKSLNYAKKILFLNFIQERRVVYIVL